MERRVLTKKEIFLHILVGGIGIFIFIFFMIFLAGGVKDLLIREERGFIVVKGSAEKTVEANLGFWTISFVESGNDLNKIRLDTQKNTNIINDFLIKNGIAKEEIITQETNLNDLNSKEYKAPDQTNRYILTKNISIKTKQVDLLEKLSQKTDVLIDQDILLKADYSNNNMRPIYTFTKLNSIKNEMIEEATKNAKLSAEKFVVNSHSKLGRIKYANQGVFTIKSDNNLRMNEERDSKTKLVRVVTTIHYYLD